MQWRAKEGDLLGVSCPRSAQRVGREPAKARAHPDERDRSYRGGPRTHPSERPSSVSNLGEHRRCTTVLAIRKARKQPETTRFASRLAPYQFAETIARIPTSGNPSVNRSGRTVAAPCRRCGGSRDACKRQVDYVIRMRSTHSTSGAARNQRCGISCHETSGVLERPPAESASGQAPNLPARHGETPSSLRRSVFPLTANEAGGCRWKKSGRLSTAAACGLIGQVSTRSLVLWGMLGDML